MRILVAGAGGMLGSAVVRTFGEDVVATAGRNDLDVRNFDAIRRRVEEARPDVVINCAADVDAEAAEDDPDAAFAANGMLPGLLGSVCRQAGAALVHFSSTGCYGAWKDEPYTEEDPVRPTTVHHRSKVSGEQAVRDSGCEFLIVRTGWLFGGEPRHKKNFVWRRLVDAAAADCLTSDGSQRGNPTFVDDVAGQVKVLVDRRVRGTFNCVGAGFATRAEYVTEIVSAFGLPCRVEVGPAFQRKAPISPNETALNYRLGLMGLDEMPHWTVSLRSYIGLLASTSEGRSLLGERADLP